MLTAVWGLYERNDITPTASGNLRAKLLGVFSLGVTAMLVMTPKDVTMHIVARVFMILAFSGSFIYVFYAGSVGK